MDWEKLLFEIVSSIDWDRAMTVVETAAVSLASIVATARLTARNSAKLDFNQKFVEAYVRFNRCYSEMACAAPHGREELEAAIVTFISAIKELEVFCDPSAVPVLTSLAVEAFDWETWTEYPDSIANKIAQVRSNVSIDIRKRYELDAKSQNRFFRFSFRSKHR